MLIIMMMLHDLSILVQKKNTQWWLEPSEQCVLTSIHVAERHSLTHSPDDSHTQFCNSIRHRSFASIITTEHEIKTLIMDAARVSFPLANSKVFLVDLDCPKSTDCMIDHSLLVSVNCGKSKSIWYIQLTLQRKKKNVHSIQWTSSNYPSFAYI